MKTYVVINSSMKSWAFGLERAAHYRSLGDQVELLDLGGLNSFSPKSLKRYLFQSDFCRAKGISYKKFSRLRPSTLTSFFITFISLARFTRVRNLKVFHSAGVSLHGVVQARLAQTMGTAYFKDSEIPLFYLFKVVLKSYCASRFITKIHFEKGSRLVLFNGREPIESSILLVVRSQSKDTIVEITERASSSEVFEIYQVSPHFHHEWWSKIEDFSPTGGATEFEALTKAEKYLQDKMLGYDSFMGQKWERYYVNDSEEIDSGKGYVAFFATSTFEYSPIPEFNVLETFPDQFQAVKALAEVTQKFGYRLIIRRHPNSLSPLDGLDYEQHKWEEFTRMGALVISPSQRVNSLKLAKGAIVSFVWRSSVGVEIAGSGGKVYALGSAKWAWDQRVQAFDRNSIRKAISAPIEFPSELLTQYCMYMSQGGIGLSQFKSVERWGATLPNGKVIYCNFLQRTSTRIRELIFRVRRKPPKRKV